MATLTAVCAVLTCDRPRLYRGWCNAHYARWQRTGDVRADVPLRAFSPGRTCSVDECVRPTHARGLCNTHYQPVLRYGWASRDDILALLQSQGGRCAACQVLLEDWHTDHDHACCSGVKSCGKCVRGLLCAGCNTALGMLGDDPVRIAGLLAYVERHG